MKDHAEGAAWLHSFPPGCLAGCKSARARAVLRAPASTLERSIVLE